jgi:hypothetical protein
MRSLKHARDNLQLYGGSAFVLFQLPITLRASGPPGRYPEDDAFWSLMGAMARQSPQFPNGTHDARRLDFSHRHQLRPLAMADKGPLIVLPARRFWRLE